MGAASQTKRQLLPCSYQRGDDSICADFTRCITVVQVKVESFKISVSFFSYIKDSFSFQFLEVTSPICSKPVRVDVEAVGFVTNSVGSVRPRWGGDQSGCPDEESYSNDTIMAASPLTPSSRLLSRAIKPKAHVFHIFCIIKLLRLKSALSSPRFGSPLCTLGSNLRNGV